MDNHIFRTAISGFNRQDVTDYIEKIRREAEESAAAQEREAAALRAGLDAARAELDEARAALEARGRELDEVRSQLEAMTRERDQAQQGRDIQRKAAEGFREESARRDDAIRSLTEERDALSLRLGELEAEIGVLRQEKARVTQLELDAHRRADEIVAQAESQAADTVSEAQDRAAAALREAEEQARTMTAQAASEAAAAVSEAEEQAAALREQAEVRSRELLQAAEDRVADTVARYNDLHQSFETITGHITSELRKLDVAAGQLPIAFDHLKGGLSELLEQAKER